MDSLFDREESERLKREGIGENLAANQSWHDSLLAFIYKEIPAGWEGPSELIRMRFLVAGGDEPPNRYCWGAAINAALNAGYLVKTGRWVKAEYKPSHSRELRVLRKVST